MNDVWTWGPAAAALFAWLSLTRLGKISSKRGHELVAAGARLLDVRTESEFASGHLPGATNIPLDRLRGRAADLAREGKPLIVYCASGIRSAGAKRTLRAAGADVHDLGAMRRW
jgi:phage shock protein E